MYLADDFKPLMRRFDLHHLEASRATTIGVRSDDTIGYLNSAWYRFARDNGVEDPGSVWDIARPLVQAILPPLRPFYSSLFGKARRARAEASHDYDCPTPELLRRFHLRVLPLDEGGLLLLHHLEVSHPVGRSAPALDRFFRDEHGMITQCCQCRMVRRAQETETWDWVPEWVERPAENTSHGLCPECLALHYPRLAERYATWRDDGARKALERGTAPDEDASEGSS